MPVSRATAWFTSSITDSLRSSSRVSVFRLNPLCDPRWAELVEWHSRASVFHTSAWLEALQRTYGFEPVAFTTSAPGTRLQNGAVFCEIRSWLTGRRLVSLPFADHCDALVEDVGQLEDVWSHVTAEGRRNHWRYIEVRPTSMAGTPRGSLCESSRFCLHVLDLRPDTDALFKSFHKDSIQRKIRRAERERLVYEEGRSEELLRALYRLLLLTRQRHGLPPQPLVWFRNLLASLGQAMTIRIARRGGQAIAGIVTLRHRDTITYKYGGSDATFHNLGGMQLLFWQTILEARSAGCVTLDLGRSEPEQRGLVTFKDRWGAARSPLRYWQYPETQSASSRLRSYVMSSGTDALRLLPDAFRGAAGRLFYRHIG
jgi:CelD/BcsL family acetyltransferase involved in cellulose biosynthesis